MGKKSKTKTLSPPSSTAVNEEALKEIKQKGDRAFASQDYEKAIESYSEAIKLLPDSHSEKPLFFSNKAACYIQQRKFKDAVRETSNSLKISPHNVKALHRRATAYEQMQLYKDALSDVQTIAKNCAELPVEVKKMEIRLKNAMQGRAATNGVRPATRQQAQNQQFYLAAKCTLNGESKLLHFSYNMMYIDFLDQVKQLFPGCGPIKLQFLDREGDAVLIAQRADLQNAVQDALQQFEQKMNSTQQRLSNKMPNIRIQVTQVSADEEPAPPSEEVKQRQEQLKLQMAAKSKQEQTSETEVIEVEEWVVEFANLFREMLHVDTDRRFDLQQYGWDKCQQALDSTIKSDDAKPLFEKAMERFQELTAVGLNNWGMVTQYLMQKELDEHINKGGSKAIIENQKALLAHLTLAEEKFNQALSFKPDHFETLLSLAGLYTTRAKVQLGFYLPLNNNNKTDGAKGEEEAPKANGHTEAQEDKKEGETETGEESKEKADEKTTQEDEKMKERAEQREKLAGICANLSPRKWREVKPLFVKACTLYEKAMGSASTAGGPEPEATAKQLAEGEQGDDTPKSQVLMAWGNTLFEESLVQAGIKGDWKTPLLNAVAKFREGGAREEDIANAIQLHLCKDQFELPPKPKDPNEPVKGLPSLPKKAAEKAVEKAAEKAS